MARVDLTIKVPERWVSSLEWFARRRGKHIGAIVRDILRDKIASIEISKTSEELNRPMREIAGKIQGLTPNQKTQLKELLDLSPEAEED